MRRGHFKAGAGPCIPLPPTRHRPPHIGTCDGACRFHTTKSRVEFPLPHHCLLSILSFTPGDPYDATLARLFHPFLKGTICGRSTGLIG